MMIHVPIQPIYGQAVISRPPHGAMRLCLMIFKGLMPKGISFSPIVCVWPAATRRMTYCSGARGALGKSSLVRAVHAEVRRGGYDLALVQLYRDDILCLPTLFDQLANQPRRFMLFVDDLSFETQDQSVSLLRSLLEGGVEARPANMRLFVTSNRRHMVSRILAENEAAQAVNARDVLDDRLALADRFGLSLGFHACDQQTYLAIISAYAKRFDLDYCVEDALSWSVGRGARSGRTAWQYIQDIAGRTGRNL